MKNIFILCFFLLFSAQTHGAGKWQKRISRFLPFVAPKAYKLEKLEQKEKAKTKKRVASMDDLGLMVLDLELRNNTYNIEILEEMAAFARKEIYQRIGGDEQAKILEFLAPSLKAQLGSILSNPKTAPHFFEVLQDAARGDLPKGYRNILQEFLLAKNEEIMALNPTPKQIKGLLKIDHSTGISIKVLQEALDRGENADEFFAAFEAIALPSPPKEYLDSLNEFFTGNAEEIGKLPFSPEQVKHIERYINRMPTGIMLLERGLKRAEGDANRFFAIFKAVTSFDNPNEKYQIALSKFFTGNAEEIGKLPFSPEQVKHIERYINRMPTGIMLLEGGLKRAEGDADWFFAIFKAVTSFDNPNDEYQIALSKFFTGNAEEIGKLPFSPEQVKHIQRYINRISAGIMFLEEGLKRAGGDADKFFAAFKAVAWASPPDEKYRDALNRFFIDNAEAIHKLHLSPEQIEHIVRYTNKAPIEIMFLEEGLKWAGGDADKFFAAFKAVTWASPPDEKYRDMLNRFFIDNAEAIMNLELSLDQIHYLVYYINRFSTSIKILELALERAEYAGDFFNVFHMVTPDSPGNKSQSLYGNFLTDHANAIVDLGPSPDQMEKISKYVSSPEILFDMAKNQKKKQRGRKKREVCATDVAALLNEDRD